MINDRLLLVGSVPFESAQDVLLTASDMLGAHLDSIPDGEVLDRRYWVLRMAFQVFSGHASLETMHRPEAPVGGERLIPASREDVWRFRLRPDIEAISFDMPGWRLGYAKDAQSSYALFSALKREGRIRTEARFKVSVPTVSSVCDPSIFGTDERELTVGQGGFHESLVAEVRQICAIVPPAELALQYDCSFEATNVRGATGLPIEGSIERNVAQFGPLTEIVPADALLGFHLCFGTFGGWPRFAPDNLARTGEFANANVAAARRPVDWIHIPALDTDADAFYAPLAELELGEARVYRGLVHSMADIAERLAVTRRYLPDFGRAAYCGLGRLEPSAVAGSLRDHLHAIDVATRARATA